MLRIALVGAGGMIGSVARYELQGLVHRWAGSSFPYGTLVVNVLGCFAIGVLMYFVEDRPALGPQVRLFLGVGVLGGFTTFSTFGYETFAMLQDGDVRAALFNVGGSVVLGLAAVWLGYVLARIMWS